jgi:hypothetical protein
MIRILGSKDSRIRVKERYPLTFQISGAAVNKEISKALKDGTEEV